ncbi:dimethylarginine dimethylaminohydrolase family protein [Metabacillus idriensis]|uniref:dimethylarginine dimethylaminohydrolase family protein n=1 Tax=Metabacillus idriensis TaxID=324768 RepID=UPI003D2B11F4
MGEFILTTIRKPDQTLACFSEYDSLKRVLVCQPNYMRITEVINETQRHYADENIDVGLAVRQHQQFVKTLEENGAEVIMLTPYEKYPEQVFTRDIGFTLGKTVFVSEMGQDIRQGEEEVLRSWLDSQGYPMQCLKEHRIEGGDVLIDRTSIFVGVSDRTCMNAIEKLQSLVPAFEVIPVPINEKYLHLDCVFNVLSETEALVFPDAFEEKELKMLGKRYNLIEVTETEQFTMGTNVLSIGDKKIISLPVNQNVNQQLRDRGYDVIEVDITEIIKSGGSFRCCTLPILRTV